MPCHKIRFWAITKMYEAGISPAVIQRTAGHLDPQTTDHYKRISRLNSINSSDTNRLFS